MNQIDLVTHYQLSGACKALERSVRAINPNNLPSTLDINVYVELRLALEMLSMAMLALEALPISGAQ